ncbi:uncharacterized protein [Watersipora subatra]|uniref:uncharacterized protein n=1 Tax=Watersipora subatra TaxID=2589382 RepID=UPI00355C8744
MAEGSKDDRFVKKLNFKDENLSVSWKTFKRQFNILRIAKKYGDMEEEEKFANLLMLIGLDSVSIYDQFNFHDTEEGRTRTLVNVIAMFDNHFEPVRNIIYELVKFNSLKQGSMSIQQFITEVHTQADNCDYGNMRDQLIRDRIVVGVADNKLREQLIDVEELDLATCIRKAKQFISHHAQAAKLLGETHDGNLDAIKSYTATSDNFKKRTCSQQGKQKCFFCNRDSHPRERCPARNATCYICKEKGHWARAKACKTKKGSQINITSELTQESEGLESLYFGSESE